MKFRTELNIEKYPNQIDFNSQIFGLGSCFVDNIKEKLGYYQFQNRLNPFGTIFNPVSIKNILDRIVNNRFFNKNDLFFHQNLWKSFELHSNFNRTDAQDFIDAVNAEIKTSFDYLKKSQWLFLTFGTAWVYRHRASGQIVSNCHKVSQQEFKKELLTVNDIFQNLKESIELVNNINPHTNILLSISPVRHLRDGFAENQLSKSHLTAAVHQIVDNQHVYYFPSYEIMMDDLRDYRFYKDDFIHPNDLAVNYIWEKFQSSLITESAQKTMLKVDKIRKGLQHRSFQPESEAESERLQKLQNDISQIQIEYPWMTFK